jgi:hypothetical protein
MFPTTNRAIAIYMLTLGLITQHVVATCGEGQIGKYFQQNPATFFPSPQEIIEEGA